MAETALREYPTGSALLHSDSIEAEGVQTELLGSETLAFSALLREVLGDLRKDPGFLKLTGKADERAASPLEPAA